MAIPDHLTIGRYGEELARTHLIGDGMRILDRNWRHPTGELDIVARWRSTLVFCEVKTRRSTRFPPMRAITEDKAARIRWLAHRWGSPTWATDRRFDVVGVLLLDQDAAVIDHRQGAL
ncbi:putative endonuclease [Stackebrandtia endophytica]|uniref:UPF0102 protein FB566_4302 n=1 Tax=Stackebrandtia endophytica TaxID=1496996 RepID=A0A543B1L9_9ACTN|nr:YraN family protein [Stackebrandtia endophytica]TQL78711.1 putative endonuclease [Stackebrandtia endophytica]